MNEQHPGEKNLNTFKILFLVKGIFDMLIILGGILYITIGQVMGEVIREDINSSGGHMPFNPAIFFTIIGIILMVIGLATGILAFMASARFGQKRGRTLIIVAAAVNCLTGILGIALCVFSIIEVQKPAVKELFTENGG